MLLSRPSRSGGMKNRITRFLNYRKQLLAREEKHVGYQSVGGVSGKRGESPDGFVDAGVDRVVSAWAKPARRGAYAPAALSARGYRKTPP
jgi:hypothetical protein